MFIFKSSIAEKTLLEEIKNFNFKNQIYINHQDSIFFIINKYKTYIKISVFDILGVETIKIIIKPKSFSKPWCTSVEKCLDFNNTMSLTGTGERIKCDYKFEEGSNNIFVYNIFGSNFNNLSFTSSLFVSLPKIYEEYKNIKFLEETSNLENIIRSVGFPHQTINLINGYAMLLYFGSHKCAKGIAFGFVMIKINKFNNIEGIYKCINGCKCTPTDIISNNSSSYN